MHRMDQKNVVLSYVDYCVYWCISKALEKWFVDNLGKIFCVNLLEYSHWFISIKISQMKNHCISMDQAR